jgi:hypothetical protein
VSASSATSEEVGYLSGVTGAIQTQIDGKADENEATPVSVSGNPITITDAANIPCESLSMTIEPIQSGSGTPSPTNVRPITGLTEANVNDGVNVWDGNSSYTLNTDGFLFAREVPISQGKSYEFIFDCAEPKEQCSFEVFKNTQTTANRIVNEAFYVSEKNKVTFTISESAATYKCRLYTNSPSGLTVSNIVLNEIANTATITFGETVYGGNVDFDSGIVTVKWASMDVTWFNRSNARQYWVRANPRAKLSTENVYCDKLPKRAEADYGVSVDNMSALVFLFPDDYESASDAINAYGGSLQVVYELGTYTELALTPAQLTLLKGYNTVSANGATISLDYQKDNLAGDIKKWVIEHFG